MKVSTKELKKGCILITDIFSKTTHPIIPKQTVLSEIHLDVLKAFNIQEVDVDRLLADGTPFEVQAAKEESGEEDEKEMSALIMAYHKAVKGYKKQFSAIQNGQAFQYFEMRRIFDPLVARFIREPQLILNLHHYSRVDEYYFHHAVAVGLLAALLAKQLKFNNKETADIGLAGLLADIGMTKLPPQLLHSTQSLSDQDVKRLRQHPIYSYQLLKVEPRLKEGVLLGVLQHHEREDGSGYPLGIKGAQTHPYSKIIAVADTFQAMMTERPYRPKQLIFKVIEVIKADQFNKFDLRVVNSLLETAVHIAIGMKVVLSNGGIGEIVFIDPALPTRPILRMENNQPLSLKDHPPLYIEKVL
ncbi:HD family phosphohydrolase [Pullulanibacillus camelliae]|uniref:HD family phosphohydrolase n=1 Tax=Pullulanibacillus camelliae TaxID=1707096 RepID=A0A8J3DVP6_9BACL|nr:HD domain-containing phosphohydrolase [Pullulanibacillus camelliae]GGE48121.1 HD family phosphohydrolase [Pullulanibacillus camelliae]